jgi:hypothetical protein
MLTLLLIFSAFAELLDRNGVVPLGGSLTTRLTVRFKIVLRTKSLMIGAYSDYQIELSNKVLYLRDSLKLTYKAIAEFLIENGYRSPRGCDLSSESVFSIYKKRKIRDARLQAPPKIRLENIRIID